MEARVGADRLIGREPRLRRLPSERRLARPSATRRRIGQELALRADERAVGAFRVINSERVPVVVPEIELGDSGADGLR